MQGAAQLTASILLITFLGAPLFANKTQPKRPAKTPKAKAHKIIFIGDSITAGYGIAKEKAFPNLLGDKLKKAGFTQISIVNAGISGSTSASGVKRLKWLLKAKPTILMLQLGANDGLRGQKIANTKKNLVATIHLAQKHQVKVVLIGMKIPPNYGPQYTKAFAKLYDDIAREEKISYIPFLFDKYKKDRSLFLPDGLHPNEKGHKIIANEMQPYLEKIL